MERRNEDHQTPRRSEHYLPSPYLYETTGPLTSVTITVIGEKFRSVDLAAQPRVADEEKHA